MEVQLGFSATPLLWETCGSCWGTISLWRTFPDGEKWLGDLVHTHRRRQVDNDDDDHEDDTLCV